MPLKHPAPALRHPSISLRMADGGGVDLGLVQRAQSMSAMANADARPLSLSPIQSDPISVGMQDGGDVPGKGKGDKIPALYEPGEFVVSNAMLKARPSLRAELHELREDVLEAQGKTVEEADANAVRYDDGPKGGRHGKETEHAESTGRNAEVDEPLDLQGLRGGADDLRGRGDVQEVSLRAADGFGLAPYTNHRNPNAPTPPGLREIGNSSSFKFGTDVAKTNAPNFTMGGNGPAPSASGVTDVTPKSYEVRPGGPGNPNVGAGGSAEAQAFREARAPAAPTAAPTSSATPTANAQAGGRVAQARAAVGNFFSAGESAGSVGGALKNVASPIANAAGSTLRLAGRVAPFATAGLTTYQGLNTDTEDYAKRFGLENTEPGVLRDLGVRALGVASDLGNNLTGGLAKKYLYRDGEAPTDALGAPAPAAPTAVSQQAAPRPSLREAAPTAEAPAAAPAANVNVTRQANGNLSFSGKDVKGGVTYGGPAGTSLRSNPIGVAPAMDQRTIDAALNNPNGTRWSSNDNATMAANIRDGVDPYRGTSRAQNTGDPAMQQMEALASSPVGTPGRNGAIRAMIALKGDQTARRGQDLSYDASMTGTRASMENNRLRMGFDNAWKEREFGAGRDDKAFDRKQATDKAWNDHAEQMFRTNVDGKDVPDTAKIALYTRSVDETIGKMIPDLLKSGDPAKVAYANKLSKEGRAALDDEDRTNFTKWFETQRVHAGSYGSINPLSASGTPSQDLRAYANPKNGNGIFQPRTDFGGGISIPNVNLDYGPNANRILPNWGTPSSLRN